MKQLARQRGWQYRGSLTLPRWYPLLTIRVLSESIVLQKNALVCSRLNKQTSTYRKVNSMQLDDILVTMGPIFGIILCGFLAGHSKLLGALSTKSLSGYVYYFALPALLFETTAQASLRDLTNWGFVMASLVGIAASFVCAFFLIRWLFHGSLLDATLDSMAAAYGNTGYM